MASRMEKYYTDDNDYVGSRSKKNIELYKEINNSEIDKFDLQSNATVLSDVNNNIDVEKIKKILDTRYNNTPKRKSIRVDVEDISETDEKIDTELMKQMQMMLFEQGIDVSGKSFVEIKSIFDNFYNQTNENVDSVKVIDNFSDLMDYNNDDVDDNLNVSYKVGDEVYIFDKSHIKELVEKYKDKNLNDSSVIEEFVGDLKSISGVKITEDLHEEVVEEVSSEEDIVELEHIEEEISKDESLDAKPKVVNAAAAGLAGVGTLASGGNINSGRENSGSTSGSDMKGNETIDGDSSNKNNAENNDIENGNNSTDKSIFDRLKQSLFHGKYGNVNHNIESALNIVFTSKSSNGDVSFNDAYKVDFIIKFNDFVFNLNSLLEEKIKSSEKVNLFIDNVCNLVYKNHDLFDNIFKNKVDINVDGKKISQFIKDLKKSYSNLNLKNLNLGKNKVSEKIRKMIDSVRTLLDVSDKFYEVESSISQDIDTLSEDFNIIDYAISLGIDVSGNPVLKKIAEHVSEYDEKGLYSVFNSFCFKNCLDKSKDNLDEFWYQYFIECDENKLSKTDGKMLESLFLNDKLHVGIHRTALDSNNIFKSGILNDILVKGLKNMGDLSSGAYNPMPDIHKTVSFCSFDVALKYLSGGYKDSSGAVLLAFPNDLVTLTGPYADIKDGSFDKIYDTVDGTPTIKPSYILGYYACSTDGTVKFYSRDEILEKNDVDINKDGYVSSNDYRLCERCFKIKNYGQNKVVISSNDDYLKIIKLNRR